LELSGVLELIDRWQCLANSGSNPLHTEAPPRLEPAPGP
jgi:hypothetical protein